MRRILIALVGVGESGRGLGFPSHVGVGVAKTVKGFAGAHSRVEKAVSVGDALASRESCLSQC